MEAAIFRLSAFGNLIADSLLDGAPAVFVPHTL
jgi:hypothetical protein